MKIPIAKKLDFLKELDSRMSECINWECMPAYRWMFKCQMAIYLESYWLNKRPTYLVHFNEVHTHRQVIICRTYFLCVYLWCVYCLPLILNMVYKLLEGLASWRDAIVRYIMMFNPVRALDQFPPYISKQSGWNRFLKRYCTIASS